MRPEKGKRIAIFDALVAGGLDPIDCTFDDGDAPWQITHTPSGSYFLIEGGPDHYMSTAVVGDGLPQPSESFTWPTVPDKVQRWASDAKRDADTPDPWDEVRRRQGILTAAGFEDAENTPFSLDEQGEIAMRLREIKESVQTTYSLTETQTRSVETKLDYIASAVDHAGRKDWELMLGGVILSAILERLLPREVFSDILEMVRQSLGHLFGGEAALPVPPTTPPPIVL